jgi:hypothetical protein
MPVKTLGQFEPSGRAMFRHPRPVVIPGAHGSNPTRRRQQTMAQINDTARWRIQILSRRPELIRWGAPIPRRGWAIQEDTSVFRDGEAVGLFASLTPRPSTGQWNLRYEWIGPSAEPARTFVD